MRVLKYIFLLLLLASIAFSIFIATQNGDFSIEKSKVINAPKIAIFNYVNDFKNWDAFFEWTHKKQDIKTVFTKKTNNSNATYNWEGNGEKGSINTEFTKEADTILQKMQFNNSNATVNWKFKDTVGGTKVSLKIEGELSFTYKMYITFNGGVKKVLGGIFEKSLDNLDKSLDYETSRYKIKNGSVLQIPALYYIGQSFSSVVSKIDKNFKIVIPKITQFCNENNIQIKGKPFIIYRKYDLKKQLALLSICVPIENEIFITNGSEFISGKLDAFDAVRVIVSGDVSHLEEGYLQGLDFIRLQKFIPNPNISHIEIYSVNRDENPSPSQWVTEIYIPFYKKNESPKPFYKPRVKKIEAKENQPVEIIKPELKTTDPVKTPEINIPIKQEE